MIPIVFSTDHNYVMPAGVTISSLLHNSPDTTYDIYILIGNDVTDEDKAKLTEQVETASAASRITFLEMGDSFKGGYEIRDITKACYYRLLIPWLIPHHDKIIYCDVDIIFKTSLDELYSIDLGNNYVAGAYTSTKDSWKTMEKYLTKIGLDYKDYINSGVLVINSKKQREMGLDKAYEKYSRKKFLYQDQDIINIVCKGHVGHFDRRFNLKPSVYATEPDLLENVVLHYAGDKPWESFSYAWSEWWEAYNRSIFRDSELYHKISARILSPMQQLKRMKKKSVDKVKQLWKNM